ncbi:hypothetical protein [Sphingobium limneticum]|uniref:Uncharacterized protein n=1 Tax=Sphingobium limneticum TaxID=1007511 RepID=A0A5J5I5T3_9SPHN|nr:hypothetical protein [Sphingobium limneticum]KAA9018279.1 hypothetical protein F4U96_09210 [Sphingobium limneticum]KAA9030915.1 hypothetical protein F4U95_09160 [Sphingobium limneticum]
MAEDVGDRVIKALKYVGGAISSTAGSVASGAKSVLVGIGKAIRESEDRRKSERLASLGSFKQVKNGVDCDVSAAEFLAHIDVKWIYATGAYSNHLTGERYLVRERTSAVDAFQASEGTVFDQDRDSNFTPSDYCHGILFKNKDGRLFLITFRGTQTLTTFADETEERRWSEEHMSYEGYKALYS